MTGAISLPVESWQVPKFCHVRLMEATLLLIRTFQLIRFVVSRISALTLQCLCAALQAAPMTSKRGVSQYVSSAGFTTGGLQFKDN